MNTSIKGWTQQTVRCIEGKNWTLEWISEVPLSPCEPIQCPPPAPIRNATIEVTLDLVKFVGGQFLTVTCDAGYRLEHFEANSKKIVCGIEGNWAPKIKACIGMKMN